MRYAILGDIHGNLAALDAVLEAVEDAKVGQLLQVGDVVGYGSSPSECIKRLQEREALVVMGNHDGACTGLVDSRTFNEAARIAIEYTKAQLSKDDLAWLEALPLSRSTDHCTISHGTLYQPERFDYIQRPEDGDPSFDVLERPVCFLGHTHRPVTLMRLHDSPHRTSYTFEPCIDLGDAIAALVNVGSVGQPRDDDPRAAYAVYDSDKHVVELFRIEYDIEQEADRILRARLPKILADRLFLGI